MNILERIGERGGTATGFAVLYRWQLHTAKKAQFRNAWRQLAEILHLQYGALGAHLYETDNGRWVAYNQWPDQDTWERARTSPPQEREVFARLRDAIALEFPPLLLTPLADLLVCEA
jgi:quinol monooxygenase YgiN